MARASRLQQLVLSELRSQSLFADREAIKTLVSLCQAEGSIAPVQSLLQQLDLSSISTHTKHINHVHTSSIISSDDGKLTKAAIQDLLDTSASTSSDDLLIQVINARAVPRICYDPIRKAFYHDPQPPALHADAKARPHTPRHTLTTTPPRLKCSSTTSACSSSSSDSPAWPTFPGQHSAATPAIA